MKYRILDHTADIMFECYGKNLDELFEHAAIACTDVMVERGSLKKKIKKEIRLQNDKVDNLLFDFLEEIIYLKDAELLLFKNFKVSVKEGKLKAACFGEKINREKHKLKLDVKAVTLHKFEVKKTAKGWKAVFILDI